MPCPGGTTLYSKLAMQAGIVGSSRSLPICVACNESQSPQHPKTWWRHPNSCQYPNCITLLLLKTVCSCSTFSKNPVDKKTLPCFTVGKEPSDSSKFPKLNLEGRSCSPWHMSFPHVDMIPLPTPGEGDRNGCCLNHIFRLQWWTTKINPCAIQEQENLTHWVEHNFPFPPFVLRSFSKWFSNVFA